MSFSKEALFHDGTDDFCKIEKNGDIYTYALILRTGAGCAKKIFINIDGTENEMTLLKTEGTFDYYLFKIELKDQIIRYYFKICGMDETYYYDMSGATEEVSGHFQFELTAGFETPDWAKGAVMYQIFTDRFCNGDTSNDVVTNEYAYIGKGVIGETDWYQYPKAEDVGRFYGGDLQGVWNKLDYLQKLGVEVIYFNPLFVSPSNHKYDTQDYDYIDPHFGKVVKDEGETLTSGNVNNKNSTKYICRTTDKANLKASNEFFAEFVKEVHSRGMKVIIDGVFNHCGSFNKWLDREGFYKANGDYERGAYESKESPYNSFFKFRKEEWPNNGSYEGWWDYDTLPKLNYEDSEKLCRYIIDIGVKWVSEPYNVDGWRLDVAADLGRGREFNHLFWKRFRAAVKKANKDAIILAEHYGSPKEWLKGDEWDTVMNYDAFMEPVTWFLTGVDKHSDRLDESMKGNAEAYMGAMTYNLANFQTQSLLVAMNELSNHDHSRFLTRTNGMVGRTATMGPEAAEMNIKKSVMKEAVVMQMTLPGAPTIYYGDEAGLCGWTDPDNRRTYPWGKEDLELIEFHRDMIQIHKQNKALKYGAYKPLCWEENVLSYGRFYGDNIVAVVINNSDEEKEIEIPVWQLGVGDGEVMERIMLTNEELYNAGAVGYSVEDGNVSAKLPPESAAVFRRKISKVKNVNL